MYLWELWDGAESIGQFLAPDKPEIGEEIFFGQDGEAFLRYRVEGFTRVAENIQRPELKGQKTVMDDPVFLFVDVVLAERPNDLLMNLIARRARE